MQISSKVNAPVGIHESFVEAEDISFENAVSKVAGNRVGIFEDKVRTALAGCK